MRWARPVDRVAVWFRATSLDDGDSRAWGPVPRGNVEGVVVLRYFPLARWKVLP